MSEPAKARNIDEYIAAFSPELQTILEKIRATIRRAAPNAEEAISYQIPAFVFGKGDRIFFAAFKHHVGFYPSPKGDARLPATAVHSATAWGCPPPGNRWCFVARAISVSPTGRSSKAGIRGTRPDSSRSSWRRSGSFPRQPPEITPRAPAPSCSARAPRQSPC